MGSDMSFTVDSEPLHAVEAEEIDRQLARLLESHHFSRSSRYPALLQFLVQQVRRGNASRLKERLIGIEVFHRPADYDTNTDPVVRVTAAEVRKRIAQYYQEAEHMGELRIDLPTGSYIPRFLPARAVAETSTHAPRAATNAFSGLTEEHGVTEVRTSAPALESGAHDVASALSVSDEAHEVFAPSKDRLQTPSESVAPPHVQSPAAPRAYTRKQVYIRLAAALLIGAALVSSGLLVNSWRVSSQTRALHQLWAPMYVNQPPLLFVIGVHSLDNNGRSLGIEPVPASVSETVLAQMNQQSQVPLGDVISLDRIHAFLTRDSKRYRDLGASETTLEDLRSGPVVLYAGFDNRWTVHLSQHLRFHLGSELENNVASIVDSKNPSVRWSVDFNEPVDRVVSDYGIVARYFDPLLEQNVLLAAGIGSMGTAAASEFVTQERFASEVFKGAPAGWKNTNFEVVFSAPVVDGQAGSPKIIAATYW